MALKSTKLIQVPMGKELVNELIQISKKTGKSRAEIIRKACCDYIDRLRVNNLEEAYEKSYEKIPEDSVIAEVSTELFAKMTEEEGW